MALHCTKANHIYHRHAYDKNTVRKDVNYHCQFIAYYVIGGTLFYLVGVIFRDLTVKNSNMLKRDCVGGKLICSDRTNSR